MRVIAQITTKYLDETNVIVKRGRYADDSTALRLFAEDGEVLSTPTVCMTDYEERPQPGHVFIRDYSENEGMLAALQEAGLVGEPVRALDAGYVKNGVHECPLINPEEIEELS